MKKLNILFTCSLPLTGMNAQSSNQEPPNILIILADDAGYADFGFMGSDDIKTPCLDELAADGKVFTDAHVAATVSSPSRAMLMTGRYGQRFGYECNTSAKGDGLPIDEEILPALLKRHDYRTACIGKWHLGALPFQHPNKKGFDTFYGLIGGSRSYYYNASRSDADGKLSQYQYNGHPLSFEGYFTDELSERAKQVVSDGDRPFMMYLSYTAPHSPNQAADKDLSLFSDSPRQVYAAMLYALDRGVGEVVKELKRTGKYENTLIFFLSDNGGSTTNNSSNYPLKGFKGNKFEGGHRIPFFITWGNKFKSKEPFKGLTSSLDIFATVIDAVNINKKELNKPIDGVSLIPYLIGEEKGNPHKSLFWRKLDSRAIRSGDYKLIITRGVDSVMYNLADQIDEERNIIEKEPKQALLLMNQLSEWEKTHCVPPLWKEGSWSGITNGYHKRLMNNQIKSATDLKKK
ncbi:MAG: sulfatase-like hydrolase/transferase [Bacteroidales bacterium]